MQRRRPHGDARTRASTLHHVEYASLPPILPRQIAIPVRRRLAHSFTVQRLLLSLFAISGPVLHTLYGEWRFLFTLGQLPADSRVFVYAISLYIPTIIIAAGFPNNPSTAAGSNFTFVPVVICSILRCFGVCLDVYHSGKSIHVNAACSRIHHLTAFIIFSVWLAAAVEGLRGRISWYVARCVHATEGAALCLCTLGLRAFGPPPHYAPGEMSFLAALVRSGLAVLLGTAILTPRNRFRVADLATRFGWNHVTIHLGEMQMAGPLDEMTSLLGGSCGSHSSERDGATPGPGGGASIGTSHHTAKLGGEDPIFEAASD